MKKYSVKGVFLNRIPFKKSAKKLFYVNGAKLDVLKLYFTLADNLRIFINGIHRICK